MTKLSNEDLMDLDKKIVESSHISSKMINFLEEEGIPMNMAVLAMGVSYASGARALGISLPSVIDLVRVSYKMGDHETH